MRNFFLTILLSPLFLNAQSIPLKENPKKILIGFSFSPDYNYRKLKNNDGSTGNSAVISARNNAESGRFGFTTGFNLKYGFSKTFEFKTGLLYSVKGYQVKMHDLFYQVPDPSAPVRAANVSGFQYLEVPLILTFNASQTKLRFISSFGFITGFLTSEKEKNIQEYADGRRMKTAYVRINEYNKFNLSLLLSPGIDYKLNEKYHFSVEPIFRYGLLKITDKPVTAFLWSAGLNLSLYYQLK